MSYQAYQLTSPNTLTLTTLSSIPKPGPNQALIRIHAVALNPRDNAVISNSPSYPLRPKPNLVPCCDGAGVVETPGSSSIWRVGDRVILHGNTWMTGNDPRGFVLKDTLGSGENDGALQQHLVFDDARLVRAPEYLSMEEASTFFAAGLTAYRALFHGPRPLEKGMTVLTQGTGGVSCYAIQIASAAGATVIATSSSDGKLAVAKNLGATHLINYRTTPDWSSTVLELTANNGVDIALDVVGASSIEQTLKAVGFGGAIICLGMLGQNPFAPVNVMPAIMMGAKTVQGQLGAGSKALADEFAGFLERHPFRPQIARVFEWETAAEGLEALKTLSEPGKIVVRVR
ncbi:hypothetical protein BAUCODRAFT_571065 [Baudoinia panamericana UAMH 10762]|uniref:Enoyl reductase (ER) domain-containing protein n=1 Tax=Baudoinia panamericana (strain UAMH 10762) TaxID=717646 RepID=M2MXD8_BAUPA|nr:uncharacterized protein BAUCODRAFT_571065 [Baudoinia panamericana UAMH 10762]EMC91324.1 hypothetical protein BAUCODRAFT_571065 [Baudoinia panamericana UAMH 10762]